MYLLHCHAGAWRQPQPHDWRDRNRSAEMGLAQGVQEAVLTGRLWRGLIDNYLRLMTIALVEVDLHSQITPTAIGEMQGEILYGIIQESYEHTS